MHRTKQAGTGKGSLVLGIGGGLVGQALIPIPGVGFAIGSAIGAAAGGALDSYVIFPALFPKPDLQAGTRLTELQVTGLSPGGGIPQCFGSRVRVPGQVIWVSDSLFETRRSESAGGKGGGNQKVTRSSYSTDVAIALTNRQLASVDEIFANDKLIWRDRGNQEFTFSSLTFETRRRTPGGRGANRDPTYTTTIFDNDPVSAGKPDYSELNSGQVFTISGAGSNFDGTHVVTDSGTDSGGRNFVRYVNTVIEFLPRLQRQTVTINNVTAQWDEPSFDPSKLAEVRVITGAADQIADSLVSASSNPTNVGYGGIAYVVIEKLNLDDFGSVLPNFLFNCKETATRRGVREVVDVIVGEALDDPELYRVTDIEDDAGEKTEVRGYAPIGPQTVESKLIPLITAFDLTAQEVDGSLRFATRGTQTVHVIAEGDLAAFESGSEIPEKLRVVDDSGFSVPDEVSLNYIRSSDLEPANIRDSRGLDIISRSVASFDLPLVLTEAQARRVLRALLWNGLRQRRVVEFTLPPSYVQIRESEVLQVTEDGELYKLLVLQSSRGAISGIIEGQAVVLSVSDAPPDTDDTDTFDRRLVSQPSTILLELLDIPGLTDRELTAPGIYVAARNTGSQEDFKGGTLYSSIDDVDFEAVDILTRESVIGESVYDADSEVDNPVEIVKQGAIALNGPPIWQESTEAGSDGAPDGTEWVVDAGEATLHKIDFIWDTSDNGFLPGYQWEVHIKFTDRPAGRGLISVEIRDDELIQYYSIDQAWSKSQLDALDSTLTLDDGYMVLTDPDSGGPHPFNLGAGGAALIRVFPLGKAATPVSCAIDAIKLVRIPLGSAGGVTPFTWDRKNTIDVEVTNGTLESLSELQVLQGRNTAVFGDEIIAYQNAELIADNTYRLSKLLRGLRDTARYINTHKAGDRFVLLDRQDLVFLPLNFGAVNRVVYVKAVPDGLTLADVSSRRYEIVGTTMRPFSPSNITVDQGPSAGPTTFTWKRRSKSLGRILGEDNSIIFPDELFTYDNAGFIEETVKYGVRIYSTTNDDLIRQEFVFDEVFVYTDVMKNADSLSGTTELRYEIFQISRIVGREGRGNSTGFRFNTSQGA